MPTLRGRTQTEPPQLPIAQAPTAMDCLTFVALDPTATACGVFAPARGDTAPDRPKLGRRRVGRARAADATPLHAGQPRKTAPLRRVHPRPRRPHSPAIEFRGSDGLAFTALGSCDRLPHGRRRRGSPSADVRWLRRTMNHRAAPDALEFPVQAIQDTNLGSEFFVSARRDMETIANAMGVILFSI
jgi:hypothetical protein